MAVKSDNLWSLEWLGYVKAQAGVYTRPNDRGGVDTMYLADWRPASDLNLFKLVADKYRGWWHEQDKLPVPSLPEELLDRPPRLFEIKATAWDNPAEALKHIRKAVENV